METQYNRYSGYQFYVKAYEESSANTVTPPTAISIYINAAVLPSL